MSKAHTQDELRSIYQEYLAWFAQQTPKELRRRRACWNWAGKVDDDGEPTGELDEPQPYSFDTWQLNDATVVRTEELIAAVAVNKVKNQIKYAEWGKQVSLGNGQYADFSSEYGRNYERGLEINRQLAAMSPTQAMMAMGSIRSEDDFGLGHLAASASGVSEPKQEREPAPKKPSLRERLAHYVKSKTSSQEPEEAKSWLDLQVQKGAISPEKANKYVGRKP